MTTLVLEAPPLESTLEETCLFTKETVAELSPPQIDDMTRDEMVEAIRVVSVSFIEEDRLEYQDRATLTRLLYLARQCCRNQGY